MKNLFHPKPFIGNTQAIISKSYSSKLNGLNRISVDRQIDPTKAIDWDSPDMAIDLEDPIWIPTCNTALTESAWFQNLPNKKKTQLALDILGEHIGLQIAVEHVLQRGLLGLVKSNKISSEEFQYIHNEIIEESRHTIMFKIFLDKIKQRPIGFPILHRPLISISYPVFYHFPEMLALYIHTFEEIVNYINLRTHNQKAHPLYKKIAQIHSLEESRHLSFARLFLNERIPKLSKAKKSYLMFQIPSILRVFSDIALIPKHSAQKYKVPKKVMSEAYENNSEYHKDLHRCTSATREIMRENHLTNRATEKYWARLGLI